MASLTQKIGQQIETQILSFLEKHQLKLLERNFRSRWGEIDLIMQENDTIVFIEVRFRNSAKFGGASASVDYFKQNKLIKTAEYYLLRKYSHLQPNCRFDVLALTGTTQDNAQIEWIKNAFSV